MLPMTDRAPIRLRSGQVLSYPEISVAIRGMRFEGGGTLPPRLFPLPNGQDIVGSVAMGRQEASYCLTEASVLPMTDRGSGVVGRRVSGTRAARGNCIPGD